MFLQMQKEMATISFCGRKRISKQIYCALLTRLPVEIKAKCARLKKKKKTALSPNQRYDLFNFDTTGVLKKIRYDTARRVYPFRLPATISFFPDSNNIVVRWKNI